jgi:hypothetical protein
MGISPLSNLSSPFLSKRLNQRAFKRGVSPSFFFSPPQPIKIPADYDDTGWRGAGGEAKPSTKYQ